MELVNNQMMGPKSEILTRKEFASLLLVGNTSAVLAPPAIIPAEHSAKLIALGYMADLSGRLRMTTPGRQLPCHRSFIQQQLESWGYVRLAARVEQRAIGGAGRGCAADRPLR
jgi:hypothetical protein